MGVTAEFQTIRTRLEAGVLWVQLHRPAANNTINRALVAECIEALARSEETTRVVVFEGLPEVFCFGADLEELARSKDGLGDPEPLYDLWDRMNTGPFVTIAHVRGRTNAGGVGFVAACDVVIAEEGATFSLSELLFGLMPACVMPFLVARVGPSRARYMTLMTQPVSVRDAHAWGLVDAYGNASGDLVRRHLLRLTRLPKAGVERYKRYMRSLSTLPANARASALAANREVFADPENRKKVLEFVGGGRMPWQGVEP